MSSRRAFLRAAVLLTASLLTGAERSGYLWHYEGNLQRTVGWQHDEAPVCPSEAPGPLRLKFPSVSCNMETILCRPLGLIYLHVYKSAGTSFMEMLDRFCEEATGNKTEKIAGYDRKTWVKYRLNNVGLPRLGSACDPELICSSPGWTCYVSYDGSVGTT